MEYRPEKRKALIFLSVMLALGLLLLLAAIFIMPLGFTQALVAIPMSLLALILLSFAAYQLFNALSMRYMLSRDGLELLWGFRRVFIPYQAFNWARSLADLNLELPLPAGKLPGLALGFRELQGLGKTEYGLTERKDAVLVSGAGGVFAISPKDPQKFVADAGRFHQMGASQLLQPVNQSFSLLWKEIWAQRAYRNIILLAFSLSAFSLILAFLLSSIYPTVLWMTLEEVPSFQLFILAVLAFGVSTLDLVTGFFLYHHSDVDNRLVRWVWIAAVVVALLLILAMILMVL